MVKLKRKTTGLTPLEKVEICRDASRPRTPFYIKQLFKDFFETHGDRVFADDRAIITGIGSFNGIPVTIAGHVKGKDLNKNIHCNFGMPQPDGYRKFQRAALQAEKFGRPVITFIDTPGAYPGIEAEERGQGEAIARCLYLLSGLRVPVIAIVTGEGGSGGALALGVADRIIMLEHAVYSILSPEGFASILWKDAKRSEEACELMKLTADDLFAFGIIDQIITEPRKGVTENSHTRIAALRIAISAALDELLPLDSQQLAEQRYQKYRRIGQQ
jgi:acetyl-CoA carboxylase carboxyl transferase subunit alpha